jgi:hypothetical protein
MPGLGQVEGVRTGGFLDYDCQLPSAESIGFRTAGNRDSADTQSKCLTHSINPPTVKQTHDGAT